MSERVRQEERLGEGLGSLRDTLVRRRADAERRLQRERAATIFAAFQSTLATVRGDRRRHNRSGEVDGFGLDRDFVASAAPLLDALAERYFRIRIDGAEQLPERPCLFVANRSGVLPWDGVLLAHLIAKQRTSAGPPRAARRPRFLIDVGFSREPFLHPLLVRLGGVHACRSNALRLLRSGSSVIVFPEGGRGATKSYRDRYRLARFGRGGALQSAAEIGCPVIPVAIAGAEHLYPILFRSEGLARALDLPVFPITPTFPWLGPLGLLPLPSRWQIKFGSPIEPDRFAGASRAGEDLALWRLTGELRSVIEQMLRAMGAFPT